MVNQTHDFPIYDFGKQIRDSKAYEPGGTNVNAVEKTGANSFKMRTYERGVEDETLSCGSGATTGAIAVHNIGETATHKVSLNGPGGALTVSFETTCNDFTNLHLTGESQFVFNGITKKYHFKLTW